MSIATRVRDVHAVNIYVWAACMLTINCSNTISEMDSALVDNANTTENRLPFDCSDGLHHSVPLVRLISNPEDYDGCHLTLYGYIVVEFEAPIVYPSRDYAEYGLRSGLLFDVADCVDYPLFANTAGYGRVKGLFRHLRREGALSVTRGLEGVKEIVYVTPRMVLSEYEANTKSRGVSQPMLKKGNSTCE